MKNLYPLLLSGLLFLTPAAKAQVSFDGFYQFGTPMGAMNITLDNSHGLGLSMLMKCKEKGISYGLTGVYSFYGHDSYPLSIMTSDSNQANTNVQVSNYFTTLSFTGKYSFKPFAGRVAPWVSASAGWARFVTDLYIEDPQDYDNCKPVDADILQVDHTWLLNGTLGMEVLLNGLTNPDNIDRPDKFLLSVSAGYTLGGNISYMNADKPDLTIANHQHNHANHTSGTEGDPYYAAFINTQTQVVHQHYIGNVYTAPLRMLEFRLGVIYRF